MSDPTIAQSEDAGSALKSCTTPAEIDAIVATLDADGLKGEEQMAYKALRRAKRVVSEGVPTPEANAKLALAQHRYDAVCRAQNKEPAPVNIAPRDPNAPQPTRAATTRANGPVVKASLSPLDFLNRAFTSATNSSAWTPEIKASFLAAVDAAPVYEPDAATLLALAAFNAAMSLPEGPAREAILAHVKDPRTSVTPPTWGTLTPAVSAPAPAVEGPVEAPIADAVAAEAERIAQATAQAEIDKADEIARQKEEALKEIESKQPVAPAAKSK